MASWASRPRRASRSARRPRSPPLRFKGSCSFGERDDALGKGSDKALLLRRMEYQNLIGSILFACFHPQSKTIQSEALCPASHVSAMCYEPHLITCCGLVTPLCRDRQQAMGGQQVSSTTSGGRRWHAYKEDTFAPVSPPLPVYRHAPNSLKPAMPVYCTPVPISAKLVRLSRDPTGNDDMHQSGKAGLIKKYTFMPERPSVSGTGRPTAPWSLKEKTER